MADDDAGTTAQGDKHYDKKPVSATANVETPGQSDQPYNPPDGELFTNTSAVSVGGGRGYSATDGDGQRKRDRVRQKVEHVKDRARTENSENKSKLRKAFGLREQRQADPTKWLHGTLYIEIIEAEHLPGDPTLVSCFPRFINSCLVGCQRVATGVVRPPQPYVAIRIGRLRSGYTLLGERCFDPKWNEKFRVPVATSPKDIEFQVKDGDAFGSPHLGTCTLDVNELMDNGKFEGWLPLKGRSGRQQGLGKAQLRVAITYVPVEQSTSEKSDQNKWDNRHAYFQARNGARVSLYSDSHHDPGETPTVVLGNGEPYRSGALWKDIYAAILNAKHFVYIAGWSVWVHNILVREKGKEMAEDDDHLELGTLLKRKAQEGVRCMVLIWDDRTSVKVPGLSGGLLSTHDEETHDFFNNTGVHVGKSLRGSTQQKNFLKGITTSTNFTHHQKVVVLDTPDADAPAPDVSSNTGTPQATEQGRASKAGGQQQPSGPATQNPSASGIPRRVVAFVGGIDLCDGRFDTHDHPIFRTLQLEHKKDFYNDCIAGVDGEAGGPRLPWHDQHCRLEGPPAFDVLTNFEQRWKHPSSSAGAASDELFDLRGASDLILPADLSNPDDPKVYVVDPKAADAWRTQVFRSIDSQCCVDFPEDNNSAYDRGLRTDRGRTVDKSIQHAYVHAIRNSRRFLYIENQYFLGGSGEWENSSHADICDQLIPLEIALRVAKAIMRDEPFAAYVVIPMWPEGIPDAGSIQEVLLWQTATIRTMYRIVAKAIQLKGSEAHPRDYLNIFCLGKREPEVPGTPAPTKQPKPKSPQETILRTRRMMIYVHAKMIIVDDEYVIEGSANINQRSMAGDRDTEIAMGAFQPNFHPQGRGVVYGHRMTCWEEHLGRLEDVFQQPHDVNCVRRVRALAAENWAAYTGAEVKELPHGHLLPYPLEIAQNGVVRALDGFRKFPDTNGTVLGKKIQLPILAKKILGKTEYVVTT
mmetsp:Transcript_9813/g.29512  ORF Transcript_9813/g.29512 Transcript_9813/m.29512 type:complete len:978 (-) Transcript_9813:2047-4980(-)|eukprot:CAMPEP_0206139692 /NCGR_PEP_ID=MMETSP1473-20131121/7014_1 /ASSEMBLY_ACC=CAM_ASM_001109 /TAXON_ID=1461547 /ORGANISM="Stichococcus sp, Strain RCC1054" /LENGTH=977 /DNA_ID=CAMNT_0053533581 /DNA_START=176 /DNA_END=3109 /DNA_ORIENTATION=+